MVEITEEKIKDLIKENLLELLQDNKDVFYKLFYEVFTEMIEDIGMLNAINEANKEDNPEISEEELTAIFQGKFISQ